MEIIAELRKPYTNDQKMAFIVNWNHQQGCVIEEVDKALLALGYSEEEKALQEKERIAQLNMTRGDFIEGLIRALGKDETDIIARIEQLPLTDIEKKVCISRVKNALDFYRGYPVIDVLCEDLGLTTEQMTQFFETKDWKCLTPVVEDYPVEEENEDTTFIH